MKLKSILSLLLLCSLLSLTPSCGTTPQAQVTQGETTLITSVDVAMQVWRDWVVSGKATQAQVDTVKADYNIYYNAQLIAKAALEKWVASKNPNDQAGVVTANQAVSDATTAVINIVTQLTGKAK